MKELYEQLMALCDNDSTPFYFSDQQLVNEHYRIFSYHFTDKESWLLPAALESRGIMFETTEGGEFIRLASRPMQKFFNKGEVDFIDYGDPVYVMHKADGSLISSYQDGDQCIMLKSKASITSDYAKLAMDLMGEDQALFDFILWCELAGYTVNMELVSPDPFFRIVLHYPHPRLIILNVRHRVTGEYMNHNEIPKEYFAGTAEVSALDYLDTVTNIEGYVCIDSNDNWWKEKAAWYLERHRAKDFVNQPNAFILLVLKEEADDVFTLIADQPEIVAEMQVIQHKVITRANRFINVTTKYWQDNKDLTRKEYAIKGKAELGRLEFALAMKYYTLGDEPDWTGTFIDQHERRKIDWELE